MGPSRSGTSTTERASVHCTTMTQQRCVRVVVVGVAVAGVAVLGVVVVGVAVAGVLIGV